MLQIFCPLTMEFPQHRADWQRKSILTKSSHNMCLSEEDNRERGISGRYKKSWHIPKTQRLSHFPCARHVRLSQLIFMLKQMRSYAEWNRFPKLFDKGKHRV